MDQTEMSVQEIQDRMDIAKMLGISVKLPEIPMAFKVIHCVVKCALCGTVTNQFIQMVKYASGVWRKYKDLDEETVSDEQVDAKVKSCWNCEAFLMGLAKEELVNKILILYAPIPSKEDVWKYVKELKRKDVEQTKLL